MENYELIQSLLKTSSGIKEGIKTHREKIKSSDCDKNGMGFNLDSRFSAGKVILSIDSWRGYYGNSGSSTALRIYDEKIFQSHFINYLNDNFDTIMFDVADRIEKKALEHKDKAKKELEDKLSKLEEIV